MQANVEWKGDLRFNATSGSGFNVMIDADLQQGPRPMELILMGLGGCTSYDVVQILKKSRQQVTGCKAEVTSERADAVPAVFTKIHVHFVVTGEGLKPSLVERAVKLSAEQYCSASLMLERGGVAMTHSFEIA